MRGLLCVVLHEVKAVVWNRSSYQTDHKSPKESANRHNEGRYTKQNERWRSCPPIDEQTNAQDQAKACNGDSVFEATETEEFTQDVVNPIGKESCHKDTSDNTK